MKNVFSGRKALLFSFILLLVVLACGCAAEEAEEIKPIDESQVQWSHYNELAEAFIDYMVNDDFDAAVAMFDRTMSRSINSSMLKAIWDDIVGHAGVFISFEDADNIVADGYFVCDITSQHENTGVTLRVVFDRNDLVAGFFIMDYPDLT